jgi:hypothetical protein
MSQPICRSLFFVLCIVIFSLSTQAQTSTFSYQGHLSSGGSSASGSYDFQFTLFDSGGAVIGSQQVLNVPVASGVFNVALDFGAAAFPGAQRNLEIAVRPAGVGAFVTLSPRQPILSTPYAVRSLNATSADNATQLGGVDANRFVQQDASGNVSITGGLTVAGTLSLDTVNAQTQYNLGGNRILGNAGTSNLFVGINAGLANTGTSNTFVGSGAGLHNTSGVENSFFGAGSGLINTTGQNNAFFGAGSGSFNTTGSFNAFFGDVAGASNSTGTANSFFGNEAGLSNTTGAGNTFFGQTSGLAKTTANRNSFLGGS